MKIFKKIGFVLLGSAVVFGVAASINLSHALETKAADEVYTYVTGDGTWIEKDTIRSYETTNFTFIHRKNSSSSNVATTHTELRVYASHSMEIVPTGEIYITAVEVTASSDSYATAMGNASILARTSSGTTSTVTGISSVGGSVATFNLVGVESCEFVKFTLAAQSRTLSWKISYVDANAPTVDVTDVTLAPKSVSVKATKSTTLTATITPSDATNKGLSWSSNNESVATVSGGVVTGVSAGTAIITVTTDDGGYTDTAQVTVLPEPVIEHDGTLADPYSVSDAILVAEDTGETATTASYYIRGFISLVKSVDTGTFGNAEFEIKDSLLDGEKFLVYRAFANSAGEAFTVESAKDIKVGFLATVYGKIVNYKSNTPETTTGSKNVSMTTHVHSIDKTQATTDASSFAVSFNTAISGVCDANGNTNVGNLTTAWDLQKTAYSAMTEGARYVAQISLADASGSDLEKAIAKYVYVANKYSLEDFMVRDDVAGAHIVSEIPNNSTNILLIIIVGLIGTSVLVGYRLVNKKKEN